MVIAGDLSDGSWKDFNTGKFGQVDVASLASVQRECHDSWASPDIALLRLVASIAPKR